MKSEHSGLLSCHLNLLARIIANQLLRQKERKFFVYHTKKNVQLNVSNVCWSARQPWAIYLIRQKAAKERISCSLVVSSCDVYVIRLIIIRYIYTFCAVVSRLYFLQLLCGSLGAGALLRLTNEPLLSFVNGSHSGDSKASLQRININNPDVFLATLY